jgi:tetratricopeptide (TPR) repeat protein
MELFKKAEKHKTGCWGGLFVNYDKVYENYVASANIFKLEKNWEMCGEAYMYAGDIAVRQKDIFNAIEVYTESAYAYIKYQNFTVAKNLFDTVIKMLIENNRLDHAGSSIKKFGDILYDNNMIDESIQYYNTSIKYLEIEDRKLQVFDCLQKLLKIYEKKKNYDKNIEICDKIIKEYAKETTYKFKMIEFYCRSIIYRASLITSDKKIEGCYECDNYLEKYADESRIFMDSKEYNICNKLIEAIEDGNEDIMDDVIRNIKSLSTISNISDDILLQIRENINDVR